ncbi:MAG: hypothetical protein AAGA75_03985 [Cyanobacteria bacterium P01_E01_bin.6]
MKKRLSLVEISSSIQAKLAKYREAFCWEAGFGHIGRDPSALLLSENKTVQGIIVNGFGQPIDDMLISKAR